MDMVCVCVVCDSGVCVLCVTVVCVCVVDVNDNQITHQAKWLTLPLLPSYSEMLQCMGVCYVWGYVMYGGMLCMKVCYVWGYVMYGGMLCMGVCYVWGYVMYGGMLCMGAHGYVYT